MSAQSDTVDLAWSVIGHELGRLRARQTATSPSNERLGIGVRLGDDDLAALRTLTDCICKLQESAAAAAKSADVVEAELTKRLEAMERELVSK
jgi:hypothetical protein